MQHLFDVLDGCKACLQPICDTVLAPITEGHGVHERPSSIQQPPPYTVEKIPSKDNANTVTIHDLCDEMHRQGYTYASLCSPKWAGFFETHGNTVDEMDNGFHTRKPMPAGYFSKVQPPEEEGDDKGKAVLSWAQWCIDEDYHVDEYSALPIYFAKFDESTLASPQHPLVKQHENRDRFNGIGYDWKKISRSFHGVRVTEDDYDIFNRCAWDVPTVAVWDTRCITHIKAFDNAGEWMYYA